MYEDDFSLDVSNPDDVIDVLRNAADHFRHSYAELTNTWQERFASAEWKMIAKVLDDAAEKIEKHLNG